MIRIFLPLICAALGLAAASCGQSEGPFAPAEAPASPHGTAAAAMASPSDKAGGGDLERRDAAAGAGPTDVVGQAPQPQATGSAAPPAPPPTAKSPDVPELGPPPAEPTSSTPESTHQSVPQSVPQSAPEPAPEAAASAVAQRRASILIGMPVVSRDGSPLGQVKDILLDRQGQATHVVVAYAAETPIGPAETPDAAAPESAPDAKLTAMPWDAAMASIKDGRLVLERTKLQQAPSFRPGEWPNLDDRDWSSTTDDYWRKVVRANLAAHPGAPIDSTARQRGRRTRGGE